MKVTMWFPCFESLCTVKCSVCLNNKDVTSACTTSDLRPQACLHAYFIVDSSLFLFSDVDAPFARWPKDQVCDWLQEQGLGLYVNMARVWISSGQTLLQASQLDLERVR